MSYDKLDLTKDEGSDSLYEAWSEACIFVVHGNVKDEEGQVDSPDPSDLIRRFLQRYQQEFDSKSKLKSRAGTNEDENLTEGIEKSIYFFEKWIIKMTSDMKNWPRDDWGATLEVLKGLRKSEHLKNSLAGIRTYMRLSPSEKNANVLGPFDLTFINLQISLGELAEKIYDVIDGIE